MKAFNVLDRNLPLFGNKSISASAGTGKTFAIEHLALRFLIEKDLLLDRPYTLDELLIVTFTRAAAKELKIRCFRAIKEALFLVKAWLNDEDLNTSLDFLKQYKEEGKESLRQIKHYLEIAIQSKSEAAIYTIHGFCAKMLQEHAFDANIDNKGVIFDNFDRLGLDRLFNDFIYLNLNEKNISASQLNKLLTQREAREHLKNEILKLSDMPYEIAKNPPFFEYLQNFKNIRKNFLSRYKATKENVISDLKVFFIEPSRKHDKRSLIYFSELLSHLFDETKEDSELFDQFIAESDSFEDFSTYAKKAQAHSIKKKPLFYPDLYEELNETLSKIILEASQKERILLNLAFSFKSLLRKKTEGSEYFIPDALIEKMSLVAENPSFQETLRERFKSVIIDEFQDTDPRQWDLFKKLFISPGQKCPNLILVGDPKQSIYLFRSADIYTYLDAIGHIEKKHHYSLNCNYRSNKELVGAINRVFKEDYAPDFFKLPRKESSFPYESNQADETRKIKPYQDDLKAFHICLAEVKKEDLPSLRHSKDNFFEEKYFFPFLASEIIRLHTQSLVPFKDMAILVHSHTQADTISSFLKERNIPCKIPKPKSQIDETLLEDLRSILEALHELKNESLVKSALTTKLLGFEAKDLKKMEDLLFQEDVYVYLASLKKSLLEDELGIFFEKLFNFSIEGTPSPKDRLSKQVDGDTYFIHFQGLIEILLEEARKSRLTSYDLISLLKDPFFFADPELEKELQAYFEEGKDSVIIETIHSSKGLEYEIVFAAGLYRSSNRKEAIFPSYSEENGFTLKVRNQEDPSYLSYLNELEAEKTRQFYVALTRARERVYLPFPIYEKTNGDTPLDLWQRALKNGSLSGQEEISPLMNFLEASKNEISFQYLEKEPVMVSFEKPELKPLIFTEASLYPFKRKSTHSFTSISKALHDLKEPNFESLNPIEKPLLPAGIETGILLHNILENVEAFNCRNLKEIIEKRSKGTSLYEYREEIERILESSFQAKLKNFTLQDIDLKKSIREMDFLHPTHRSSQEEEYLQGAIDLIFYHEEKYYILDWKTNWLGNKKEDYEKESLIAEIEKNRYDLQAKIYMEALRKYLAIYEKKPFHEIFGGCFYLFLRGTVFGPDSGVYFIPFKES